MNSPYTLAIALRDILQVVNPTDEDWHKRFQILNDLGAVVGTLEILRGATVEPFGSFVSNLFTKWGDLDISIELANGSYISSAGKKCKQNMLLDVLKALKRRGGFHGVKYISHARVPILKCESNKDNISCDISINNLSGQMKSKMLFWINDIDSRFRDMVLIAKEWAKAQGINDPKTGTLNSYSLSLLIVFHFQTCEPPIFPPLSEIYPGNMVAALTGVRAAAEKHIEEICSVNINRIKSDRSRPINRSSLADLFISFLGKFRDISLRAATQGISPHNGQWEDIATNMIWQPKTYALFIEDPFEQPMNSARTVGNRNLKDIASAFQSSYQKLTSPDQHHPLSVLVRPEVLSIMSRSQAANSGILGMNPLRNPQVNRNPVGIPRARFDYHPQSYRNNSNNGYQYQNRNGGGGGSQVNRGAHAPTQVQGGNMYQYSSNNRVNQRPTQGSQSQAGMFQYNGIMQQSQAEQVQMNPNNGVYQGPGSSSQSRQVQTRWRARSQEPRNE
ncbi:nucleotidyltransferase family protein [Artemisia annua]|uniref:Nucleotidyltransferase family protein n=1 Tax=Artemisia annua TaxID=35608 RepID=A0A2U1NBM8_ARTAN|nr:nucleotidyltransferase family protein [Artemisia annua]